MPSRAPAADRVGVVVLNYDAADETRRCVEALGTPPAWNLVVVVDNGSPGGPGRLPDLARRDGVRFLQTGTNLGYGGGNNVALEALRAEGVRYALVLNNDARITWDDVRRLRDAAEGAQAGAAGPLVLNPDGSLQSAGGRLGRLGVSRDTRDLAQAVPNPDYLVGCAILLDLAALEKVGAFDPAFFLFAEEKDLCLRLTGAGFPLLLVPEARCVHARSTTVGRDAYLKYYHMARSNVVLRRRWTARFPRWLSIPAFVAVLLASDGIRSPMMGWAGLRGFLRGLRDGCRAPLDRPAPARPPGGPRANAPPPA